MTTNFWRDAAKGGIIIGAIVIAATYIKAWLAMSGSGMGTLFTLLELVAVVYFVYRLSKQRSMLYDSATGYSYGQNMGFVMAVMLLAGVIYGIGYYFLVNHIFSDYGAIMIEASEKAAYTMYGDMADAIVGQMYAMLANPIFWLFYGVFAMVIYGGIIGLFVSAFTKRRPDVFANNTPQNNGQES